MPQIFDFPNLVAALDAGKGVTTKGYTFLDRDQKEQFYSFEKLREEAMRRAAHFRHYGLKKGDRLAMVVPDGEDFVPTFLAAVWAGIVPVPLYPPLSMGKLDAYIDTLVAIMGKAKPTYLVTNEKVQAVLWGGISKVPSVKGVITTEELRGPRPKASARRRPTSPTTTCASCSSPRVRPRRPRASSVTHGSLRANAWAIMRDGLKTDTDVDHGVSWLPLYHDMGLIGFVIAPLFHRVSVTFIPTLTFVRNATIWLRTIHKVKGTITFAPNFAYALAVKRAKPEQLASLDLSSMRALRLRRRAHQPHHHARLRRDLLEGGPQAARAAALLRHGRGDPGHQLHRGGGGALDRRHRRRRLPAGPHAPSRRRWRSSKAAARRSSSPAARPSPSTRSASSTTRASGSSDRRIGEIWVRGPSIAKGYFEDAEATERTFGNGWLKTGDFGYLVNGNVVHYGSQEGHHHHQRAQLRPAAHGVDRRRAPRGPQGLHRRLLPSRHRRARSWSSSSSRAPRSRPS